MSTCLKRFLTIFSHAEYLNNYFGPAYLKLLTASVTIIASSFLMA